MVCSPSPHHNRLTDKSRADRFSDYLATTASDADGPKTFTAFVKPSLGALRRAIRRASGLADKNLGVEITSLPLINPPGYEERAGTAAEEGVNVLRRRGIVVSSPFALG